jgi:hypothetical protein
LASADFQGGGGKNILFASKNTIYLKKSKSNYFWPARGARAPLAPLRMPMVLGKKFRKFEIEKLLIFI